MSGCEIHKKFDYTCEFCQEWANKKELFRLKRRRQQLREIVFAPSPYKKWFKAQIKSPYKDV
jgi:hypothetical protein